MGRPSGCLPLSHCSFFHCEYSTSETQVPTDLIMCSSFVTSFFGMNTADVRELDRDQRIFWTSAIPLTLAVSSLALNFGYKWDTVTALFSKAFKFQDSSGLYEGLEKDLLSQLGEEPARPSRKSGYSSISTPGISSKSGFEARRERKPWEKRVDITITPEPFQGLSVV
jgi:hypothetical protein